MMRKTIKTGVVAMALTIGMSTFAAADRLVVLDGFDQSAEWQRKPFCGRDFFPLLMNVYWADPNCRDVPEGYSVYRECGWRAIGAMPEGVNDLQRPKAGWKDGYAELLPEEKRRKAPYRLWDFFAKRCGKKYADHFYEAHDLDRPFLLFLDGVRPEMMLNKTYPLANRKDFADWKAKHPNYFGNYTMMEFDHETSHYFITFKETKDGAAMTRLEAAYPCAFKDWAWNTDVFDTWIDEAKRRSVEFYFGEDNQWAFSSGCPGLIPLFARAGCKGVCYEATTQSTDANWRIAGAYLRGAARQFGMSYGWYTANWFTGYRRGSDKIGAGENSTSGTSKQWTAFGLNRGCSFQMIDRQNAYGWLIGARYVEPENWYWYHREKKVEKVEGCEKVEEVEKYVPSAAAKDFQALYDLSKREDRGQTYSPLAILFPIHEKTSVNGKQLYSTGYRQSAALLTLAPTTPVRDARRYGMEGGFYNSEFGEIFDIVCPDATNDVEMTLAALRPYKAAAMFGRFRLPKYVTGAKAGAPEGALPQALTRYAEEGGTLFVSEEYVGEGVVEAQASGVKFPHRKVLAAGEYLVDDRGARVPLRQPYVLHVGEPTTAEVFWRDEKGQPIAYLNRVGRGKVVTVTASGMMPEGWMKTWGIPDSIADDEDFLKIYHQDVTFEIMRAIFLRVQSETMPFAIAGDIHWGVNKIEVKGKGEGENLKHSNTSSRWLVWLFNNKGLVKYIGDPTVVDHRQDAKVTVTGAPGVKIASVRDIRIDADARDKSCNLQSGNLQIDKSDNSFTVTVPAGGWSAYEIETR